jgi:hypothetical protein
MYGLHSSAAHHKSKIVVAAVSCALIGAALALEVNVRTVRAAPPAADATKIAAGRKAFLAAYEVFMHPRCMNCHPDGDSPLQGDDSHLHIMNVQRGPDGRGQFALKCKNCHQDENRPGLHMPPGNPNWHLTPPSMPMVFQGRTAAQLARQLKDPSQNGNKTIEQIVHHVTEDKLVLWGWEPGDGRTLPPLTHAEFAAKVKEWADSGAPIPE